MYLKELIYLSAKSLTDKPTFSFISTKNVYQEVKVFQDLSKSDNECIIISVQTIQML